jgi:hypothetical protein
VKLLGRNSMCWLCQVRSQQIAGDAAVANPPLAPPPPSQPPELAADDRAGAEPPRQGASLDLGTVAPLRR